MCLLLTAGGKPDDGPLLLLVNGFLLLVLKAFCSVEEFSFGHVPLLLGEINRLADDSCEASMLFSESRG